MSGDLERRGGAMRMSVGREFQAGGTACAKALSASMPGVLEEAHMAGGV